MNETPFGPYDLSPKLQHAMQLISALCDDRITLEQFAELESLVCSDREVRVFYVEMTHLHAGLYYFASAMPDMVDLPNRPVGDETDAELPSIWMGETMMLPALREPVGDEDPQEVFPPTPSSPTAPVARTDRRNIIKGGIAALITIGLGLLAYFAPQMGSKPVDDFSSPAAKSPWTVAWTQLSHKPVWEDGTEHAGTYAAGESLRLASGAVQLQLRHNGKLVVEGPADVQFITDSELKVNKGRIVATFPGGGLKVHVPSGFVMDLGTQFGVFVDSDAGKTEVDVFQGRVSAALASKATTQPVEPLLLSVGQAAIIGQNTLKPAPEGAIPQRYVCNLQNDQVSSLDVTDLVSGGDGTTHRRGIAVDALTGDVGVLQPVGIRNGDLAFHRASGLPVVDGAFVPNGSKGPMTVDSAGHQFQFPPTTGQSTNQIWTGGPIAWFDELGISTVINGVDYSTPDHGIICTHSNNALTLNLDAVRRLYPDRALTRFHCHFGNSYINGLKGATKVNPIAGVYVLIDGVSRYAKPQFSNQDGLLEIDLPIGKTDRFMTLAAVDDDKEIDRDWILWTDARLDLAPGN